ncbi:hypothetical protein ABDJ41_07985 [Pedobacter sp. ASV1-7]|uniref:hypothetical protein n=1 Tax=Pedobacter sp. ASV1-7 TaxID=3145237 RepID=UPI0032E8E2FF
MKFTITKQKNIFIASFLFLLIISTLSACKKKKIEPKLPAVTMEGKNTFGCFFGSDIWIPELTLSNSLMVDYSDRGMLIIECKRRDRTNVKGSDMMTIKIKDIFQPGVYEISEVEVSSGSEHYFLDDSGKISITLIDNNRHIVSGTFDFQLKERSSSKIIHVSAGRFDVVYINY